MINKNWRPSASISSLRRRAAIFERVRRYFSQAGVLEVDTPILSRMASVEPQIESFRTTSGEWLSTSPEFAMKRLIAAGSGPIFQLSRVFRLEEAGRLHGPEFMMLEWYRPGFGLMQLIDDLGSLLLAIDDSVPPIECLSYRAAFVEHLGIDPFDTNPAALRSAIEAAGVALPQGRSAEEDLDADYWLDLAMGVIIGPRLGLLRPLAVVGYPPSQAALARVRDCRPPVAERFELYWRGIELANGFDELIDADEQLRRFRRDQQWRAARGRVVPEHDEFLISALSAGMPACSGVAVGLDRLVMLLIGASQLSEAMSFDFSRV